MIQENSLWMIGGSSSSSSCWSRVQDKLFEQALVIFPEEISDRWQKIANEVPGKTAWEVKQHYEALVRDVLEIDNGRVSLPCYTDDSFDDMNWDSESKKSQISFGSTKLKHSESSERKKGSPWTPEEHNPNKQGHNRDDYIRHLPHQLPVLIVTTEAEKHIRHWQTRSYYDLSENRVCKFPLSVPHCDYFHSFFSSEGWLIRDEGQYVSLFNPFLSVDNVIMLPSLEDEDDEMGDDKWLGKAALSANPALNPNYVLMAVCFGNCWKAAFYKPGNPRWTSLLDCEEGDFIVDVIYSGYQFYAMTTDGSIWAYDLSFSIPNVSKVAPCIDQTERIGDCLRYYLVESLGELLGVKRNWSSKDSPYTLNFQVFRLDQNMFKWIETKSLSGRSLFVGNNTSMSIMASDFPRCKPNCIYFTHEGRNHEPFEEHSHDMGVYNLEDGSIEPHYLMESIKLNYPAPMWIEPTFTK